MANDKKICDNCRRELDVGVDVIKVNEGVIGTRDFVSLESAMFFCCEKCLKDYFDLGGLPSLPRRIP